MEILPDRIIEYLVTTTNVDKGKIAATEAEISRRTGKLVSVQVRQVANEEDLISLRGRLIAPEPPPPPANLKNFKEPIWPLVDGPLKSIWQTHYAESASAEVGFSKEAILVRVVHYAPRAMDSIAQETLRTHSDEPLQSTLWTLFSSGDG